MKLIFKQKMFSFLDSYNIYNENGKIMFTVKSQFYLFGKHFYVYDKVGQIVGQLKQKPFTYLPVFDIYLDYEHVGRISKKLNRMHPTYVVDYKDWLVEGNFFEYNYTVKKYVDEVVATVSKRFFNMTDTYEINVLDENDAVPALMLALAIDGAKDIR